jgi:hypothetical protein
MPTLLAEGLRVDGDLTLARLVSGAVSLFRAEIGGNLWLNAACLSGCEAGFALHGAQLRVGGGVYAESIQVTGGLNLWGAQAFSIDVTDARLAGDTGPALRGDGLSVDQDLCCSNLVISDGGISLFGATIGGQVWLNTAEVRNTTGWAVNAPMVSVGGGIYGRGLAAHGGINLFAAKVGESVELPACTLVSRLSRSLRAPGARVGGSVALNDGARVGGNVDLSRANVEGRLAISGATFPEDTVVDLQRAAIGILDMAEFNAPPAALDLRAASIATIEDGPDCWPQRIAFDMLTYQALNPVLPADRRLAWLDRASDRYHPQPYEHLAVHYRQLGHDDDARTVLLAGRRLHRRGLRPSARLWGHLEDATVGYGYRPGRALGWLLALTAVVAIVFSAVPPRPVQTSGPSFQPAAYALDLILPILDLGQEKAFAPVGLTRWVAWAASLAGWLLATTVIAGITRRLARS